MVNNIAPINNINEMNLCQKYLVPKGGANSVAVPKQDSFELTSAQNKIEESQTKIKNTPSETIDPNATQKKKSKKKTVAIVSLTLAGATILGSVIFGTKFWNKGISKKLKHFMERNEDIFNFSKAKQIINKENMNKGANVMNNLNSAKDAFSEPFFMKFPGIKKLSQKISTFYKKTGVKTTQNGYTSAIKSSEGFSKNVSEVLEQIKDGKLKGEIAELLSKRNGLINKNYAPQLVEGRADDIAKIMDADGGVAKKTRKELWDAAKKLLKKETRQDGFEKISNGFIAEDLIKVEKQAYIDKIKAPFEQIKEIDKQIVEKLENCGLDDFVAKHSKKINNSRANSQKSLRKAIVMEGNDLFDKMRDINVGCAPSDVAGMATTAGLLGIYLAQADTKDQRVEVALTTGIPLGLGMVASTVAMINMISGFKAIALGGVATFVANIAGKIINKKYQKAHNIENQKIDIPTLDSTTQNIHTKINNGVDEIKKRTNGKNQ